MAYGIGGLADKLLQQPDLQDTVITAIPARVVDIILDDTHPEWTDQGEMEALGAIKFRLIGEDQSEEDPLELDTAFPLSTNFKIYPLLNEIVMLYTLPDLLRDGGDERATKIYYTTPLAMWNNPEANPFPDTSQNPGAAELGYEFEEKSTVAPLQPFHGDITIEGRQGQTIRFTGVDHSLVEVPNDDQKPITIISNGKEGATPDAPIVEVIDDDPASIYLVADHTVPLTQAHEKRDAWDGEPDMADTYKGSQVLINSGRLYFNAKEESILFSATDAIGGNAKRVSFDGDDYVAVDATKVYLGTEAFGEREPVLLGATTQDWMRQLLDELKRLGTALAGVVPAGSSAGGLAQIKSHGASMSSPLSSIKKAIDDLDSEKVFTE